MADTPTTRLSPDGRYRLEIRTIQAEGRFARKEVEVLDQQGRLIGRTKRNFYRDEIFSFVQQDGRDYLVLSENYHGGYGCMDLQTGEKVLFEPINRERNDQHWIWVDVARHDPEAMTLAISGCYWAGPFEEVVYDFSNPMEVPYREISRRITEED